MCECTHFIADFFCGRHAASALIPLSSVIAFVLKRTPVKRHFEHGARSPVRN